MALVFARRLAMPLWAIAFFTVALTASPPATLFLMPPTTLLVIAALGIALIVFRVPSAIPWLRRSRSLVPVRPSRDRDRTNAAIEMAAGAGVRKLDEPNRRTVDDALDSARMDDDGGRQMARSSE
jgi:uncharacterized iron-regulated membrane protein